MAEIVWNAVVFILRAINFALETALFVERMQRFARWITGSNAIVAVPPDPKILPPAARRSLAEAEQRYRDKP